MPCFANVPRPAAPENKVAVADLFQVKTSANAPAGTEEITHLGTFFRDTPAPPRAPSPGPSFRVPIGEDIGDDDHGPAPSARRVVREITARSPRLRAIISREADAFIAQNLDSEDSSVAVFATRRLKIPVGMVTIEGGPKVKVFDPDASARKIGVGLADGGISSVFIESQTQLNRLVKFLDGEVSVPGRTGLKLEAIFVPNELHLNVPERHAPLIKSLENYQPSVDRNGLKLKRRDRLEESAGLGFESPLSALTAPGSDEAKAELRLRVKDSNRASRLGLDLAESGNLLELAAAEVFNASLRMDRPISARPGQEAKVARLAAEVPADIFNKTILPSIGRAEAKQRIEANSVGVELTPESVEGQFIVGRPKADNFFKLTEQVISTEDLERLRNKGALGKIAALAITTEEEIQRAGNKLSADVLAQKRMLDAMMSPALRSELGQLFENVTGQTTIIFAPREAVVSDPQADFDFPTLLPESARPRTTPRGQILSIGDAFAVHEQAELVEPLEVAA